MDGDRLKELIEGLVRKELEEEEGGSPSQVDAVASHDAPTDTALAKRVAEWVGAELPPMPWAGKWQPVGNRTFYLTRTPARLGVGRVGTRYRTETVLDFLADHAAARDAVASQLDPEMCRELGLVQLQSAAEDKREFLARPDLGRSLSADSAAQVHAEGAKSADVQIVVGDGLSAAALNANLPAILPILLAELKRGGASVGTLFAVGNARVACGDEVARATDAEVLCTMVGERPGLKTAESMGAYVTYMKVKDLNESMRNMISNIHAGGLTPEQGAKEIAALCLRALRDKRTGVEFSP